MAYTRPGVSLTQEFLNAAPALALFSLPNVHVGPAFQVVADDNVGTYSNASVSVGYVSKVAGAIIDTRPSNPSDLLNYPVQINLKNATVQMAPSVATGAVLVGALNVLNDPTTNVFQFINVGDLIIVTAPGPEAMTYTVTSKIDNNNVQVNVPFQQVESAVTYSINRVVAGPISVPVTTAGVSYDANQVTLPAGLVYVDPASSSSKVIEVAEIHLTYRAQRFEISTFTQSYTSVTALQAAFGVSQIVPQNPVVFSVFMALLNTATPCNLLELPQDYLAIPDELIAHEKAINVLQTTSMYAINVLTQRTDIHQIYSSHVNEMSQPLVKKWRVAIINRQLQTQLTVIDNETTGVGTSVVTPAATNGEATVSPWTLLSTTLSNGFASVKVGDQVVITGGTNSIPGTYTVSALGTSTSVTLSAPFATGASSNIAFSIDRKDGLTPDGLELNDQNATFITSGATPGMYLNIVSGNGGVPVGQFKLGSIVSQTKIQLAAAIPGVSGDATYTDIVYYVNRDMTLDEQASFIATYTQSLANRRLVHVWPDIVKINVANVPVQLPGYFLGSAVAGLTTGLPTQQGFTNLSVSGYVGVVHSSIYFSDDQLDVIAGGGSMVFAQAVLDQTAIFIRHQLTTDLSAIKFQEYSVTKNVDFISYFIVTNSSQFVGVYNIYEGLFDDLKLNAQRIITFLRDKTRQDRIGSVIRNGKLTNLAQDTVNIDTVDQTYNMTIPIPLNHLNITLQV